MKSDTPITDDAWRRYTSMEWTAKQAINVSRLLERKLGMLQHVNAQLCAVLAEAGAPQDPANGFEMAAWAQRAAKLNSYEIAQEHTKSMREALEGIASAKGRGFGIDYVTECARKALLANTPGVPRRSEA